MDIIIFLANLKLALLRGWWPEELPANFAVPDLIREPRGSKPFFTKSFQKKCAEN